ncbi:MAG: hypothetical protein HY722_13895 [Planctomycetes bacterium]|nr:hypothetical protein [Planctomycetota bacterium]
MSRGSLASPGEGARDRGERRRAAARTHLPSDHFWFLFQEFFRSRGKFASIHAAYEGEVLRFARERGVDRKDLRLDVDEVSRLLDFRELERLRNRHMFPLKEIAHGLFRGQGTTDVLDRYLSDIFHEVSILKEEQYKAKDTAPGYRGIHDQEEVENILAEVHEAFPQKVHHISSLFGKAQERIEALLPLHAHDKVFCRSLYLHGPALLRKAYPRGVEDVYRILYPAGGPGEGYLVVGQSFLEAGFLDQAREALTRALEYQGRDPMPGDSRDGAGTYVQAEARALMERLKRRQREQESPPAAEPPLPSQPGQGVV